MGDTLGLPRINEVAAYLDRYAPSLQTELRGQGSEIATLTEVGVWGGDDEVLDQEKKSGLILRAKILDAALGEAIAQSEQLLVTVTDKLNTLRRTRFASLLFGAIGSSSVIALAFTKPMATLIAGALALIANVVGLAAESLVLGQKNSEGTLREAGAVLARVNGHGALTRKLLAAMNETDFNADEIRSLIAEGNALFGELMAAREKLVSIA